METQNVQRKETLNIECSRCKPYIGLGGLARRLAQFSSDGPHHHERRVHVNRNDKGCDEAARGAGPQKEFQDGDLGKFTRV